MEQLDVKVALWVKCAHDLPVKCRKSYQTQSRFRLFRNGREWQLSKRLARCFHLRCLGDTFFPIALPAQGRAEYGSASSVCERTCSFCGKAKTPTMLYGVYTLLGRRLLRLCSLGRPCSLPFWPRGDPQERGLHLTERARRESCESLPALGTQLTALTQEQTEYAGVRVEDPLRVVTTVIEL